MIVDVNKYSIKQYYQIWEQGVFDNKRVELIEGEIINNLPLTPQKAMVIRLIAECLRKTFGETFVFNMRLPLSLGKFSEPEPDIAVVKGEVRDYLKSHPKTAELIVEVSDTTLRYDRDQKASLYAKNKIKDYWILNLKDSRLEVYRRPIKDDTMFYGFGYAERLILTAEDKVSPLAKTDAEINVADLLP